MDVRVGPIKKAEHRRIYAFELWCWRRLLRVPWTARRSSQSILTEIRPRCSLEGLMLKLKLQYFGHLMQSADSFEKTLMLEKICGGRRSGWQIRWLDVITDWWTWVWEGSGSWWWTRRPGVLQSIGLQRTGHDWVTELNWTDMMSMCRVFSCVVGRGWLLWSVHSLDKTLLAFALLHFVLQGQFCLLFRVSLDFYFCIPVPYNEKAFFSLLVLEGLLGLHRTV